MSIQNPPTDSLSPFNVAKFTQYPTLTISYLDSLFLSKRNTTTSSAPLTTFTGLVTFDNIVTFNQLLETTNSAIFGGDVKIGGTNLTINSTSTTFNDIIKTRNIIPLFSNVYSLGSPTELYNNLYLFNSIVYRGLSYRPNGIVATMTATGFFGVSGAPVANVPFDIFPLLGSLTFPLDSLSVGDTIHIKYTGVMTYTVATSNVVFNITRNGVVIIRFNFKTPISAPTTNVQFTGDVYIFIKTNTQSLGSININANSFTGTPPNLLYDSGYTSNASTSTPFGFGLLSAKTLGMTYTNTFTDPSFSTTLTNFTMDVY
jgi:hypothetical protein